MAGIYAYFNIPLTAMVANTAKTILQVVSPANQRLKILEIGVQLDSTSTTPGSAELRVLRQTTAGTVTAATPVSTEPEITETLQATGGTNASGEPTAGSVLMTFAVPITSGMIYPMPVGQEIMVGGSAAARLGFELKIPSGATANAYGWVKYEE